MPDPRRSTPSRPALTMLLGLLLLGGCDLSGREERRTVANGADVPGNAGSSLFGDEAAMPPDAANEEAGAGGSVIGCAGTAGADQQAGANILGITLGMLADEAHRRLGCANPGFELAFTTGSGFRMPPLPDGREPRSLLTARTGLEEVTVYLVGMPGAEKVVGIVRNIEFSDGSEPTGEQLLASLRSKYGPASRVNSYQPTFAILKTPDGRTIGPDNSIFSRCRNNLGNGASIYDSCGLSIDYSFDPKDSNTALVRSLKVAVIDQKGAMDALAAYGKAASQAVNAQRASEVQNASQQNDRMPSL